MSRVRLMALGVAAMALGASPVSPRSKRELPLQPTGKWLVDYADSQCVLQREYGTTRRPLTLGIQPDLMDDKVKLVVVGGASGGHKFEVPASVSFGTSDEPVKSKLDSLSMQGRPIQLNETFLKRSELNRAMVTERIDLEAQRVIDVHLAVPGIASALTILDECVADLLDGWGFSRLEQRQLARFARPHGGELDVSSDDYPEAALDKGHSGPTVARVSVGVDGTASDCKIVSSSKSQDLDEASCKVLLRSRYEPAITKAGEAVASVYIRQLHWRMVETS